MIWCGLKIKENCMYWWTSFIEIFSLKPLVVRNLVCSQGCKMMLLSIIKDIRVQHPWQGVMFRHLSDQISQYFQNWPRDYQHIINWFNQLIDGLQGVLKKSRKQVSSTTNTSCGACRWHWSEIKFKVAGIRNDHSDRMATSMCGEWEMTCMPK